MTYYEFPMPCLSKYTFTTNGECVVAKSGQYLKMKNIRDGRRQFDVTQDDGIRTTITEREIIQYGKHIAATQQYQSGGLELRLPSKINKL